MSPINKPPALVYLHGFNSSPQAAKADAVALYLKKQSIALDYFRPTLPDKPSDALSELETLMTNLAGRPLYLMGSSLGGFYATWLVQTYAATYPNPIKAVLVNPAVRPHELMSTYLGVNRNPYSGNVYALDDTDMSILQRLYVAHMACPENFLVLLQMGDEVLNPLEASRRYRACCCMIAPGGDHRFQHFDRYLPRVFDWFDE